jgi:hypothetical protein
MKLIRAVSCWGNRTTPVEALDLAIGWGFEAVEARVSNDFPAFGKRIEDEGKELIAEIVTGCEPRAYVPDAAAPMRAHLDDFRRLLDLALAADPLRITVLAGSDMWDFSSICLFYAQLLEITAQAGVSVCIETHRARPTFHPVRTAELLAEFCELELTLDVSHWCAVCERLIPGLPGILDSILPRVRHVHARVGYDQGPQVPDPRVPLFSSELDAHLSCWEAVALLREECGAEHFTITPEFGPDGYLQRHPVTGAPAADLREINRWMGGIIAGQWNEKYDKMKISSH